jgi:hypothetical protein
MRHASFRKAVGDVDHAITTGDQQLDDRVMAPGGGDAV